MNNNNNNMITRNNKTVLITGANKGIGFATAKQLALKGYFVYFGCRDKEKGKAVIEKLEQEGINNVSLMEIDVTDAQSVCQARLEFERHEVSLDVLINNAAIGGTMPQAASSTDVDTNKMCSRLIFWCHNGHSGVFKSAKKLRCAQNCQCFQRNRITGNSK